MEDKGSVSFFHELEDVRIKKASVKESDGSMNYTYALMVQDSNKIQSVEIEYEYLGQSFKKNLFISSSFY